MYARVQNYAYNSHNLVEKNHKTFGWLKNQNEELQTQYRYRLLFDFCHFVFTKDLRYYRFSLTKRNPKRIIAVMKKGKKWKVGFSLCFAVSHYRGRTHPQHWEWTHQAPSLRTILSISASSYHSFELHLWASVLYLYLFCPSVSKMYPKVISCFFALCHLAYERFHRNALLLGSWRNLDMFWKAWKTSWRTTSEQQAIMSSE